MPLRAGGSGPAPTRWSAAWSTNSAAFGLRCDGPKSWPAWTRTTDVRIVSYPGSSLLDLVRPRASSQPAAASLPDAVGALLGRTVTGVVQQIEQTLSGVNVLWLGQSRF